MLYSPDKPKPPAAMPDLIKQYMPYKGTMAYPCRKCRGSRRMYDPNDPPCPIEGYKMVGRVNCDKCNGTGESTSKDWRDYRKKLMQEYRTRLHEWRILTAVYKDLKQKLSGLDKQALRLFGIPQ